MKIVDMHCDTLSALLSAKRQGKNFDFENSDTQISLSKMQAGGLSAPELRHLCKSR